MNTNFKTMRNLFLFVLTALLIVSLATVGIMSVNAQEEEPTVESIRFTSYAVIMDVDEEFTFSAEVTYSDGSTSDEVTWSSSNPDVLDIDNTGYALAIEEGQARITAAAGDVSAYVDVLVSSTTPRAESIEVFPETLDMGIGWKTRIGYTILPADAYDTRVTWASSADSIVSVDDNGNIEALAEGSADITVTTFDQDVSATCTVTVSANLGEATLTPATLTTMIGQVVDNEFVVSVDLPEDATVDSYQWLAENDGIASFDPNSDETGTVFSWSFGTTAIHVVVTDSLGNKYAADGSVLVTAEYYYLTGLVEDLPDPTGDPWIEYETEEEARQAGVLLEQKEPGLFSITREFWANDLFQIIHNDMDEDWTTKITSTSFSEEGSNMHYVANSVDSFGVSALGSYNVTLDLRNGPAKVTIDVDDLTVTSIEISVSSSNKYLQYVSPASEDPEVPAVDAKSMTLDVNTLPTDAEYALSDVTVTIPENVQKYVSAAVSDENGLQVVLSLLPLAEDESFDTSVSFQLAVKVENGTDDITINILADNEEYVAVDSVAFGKSEYILNVNNGAAPWQVAISATAMAAEEGKTPSVTGIVYSTSSDHIWVEFDEDGNAFAHANALGTYTITATALGDSDKKGIATVLVTSLIGEEEPYQTGFYLIGQLDGVEVGNWTSIKPDVQTFEGSDFAKWTLSDISDGNTVYSGEFDLRAGDRFSIAFLGMDGNWYGIIDNQYMSWEKSQGTYWENDINIEMSENGHYVVTLDLSGETPFFYILRDGDYNPGAMEYDLWLYIVRAGDSWNADLSQEGNIVARIGYIHIVDGKEQGELVPYEADSNVVDFYEFFTLTNEWPNIQFVTAYGGADNNGIEGGSFLNATWYGDAYTVEQSSEPKFFSGDAYSETGEADHFTNHNAQLYWVSSVEGDIPAAMEGKMTVSFTFTFDGNGVLTGVKLDFVTAAVE